MLSPLICRFKDINPRDAVADTEDLRYIQTWSFEVKKAFKAEAQLRSLDFEMLILTFSGWKVGLCFSGPFSLLKGWHLCNCKACSLLCNGWRSGSWIFAHVEKQIFIQHGYHSVQTQDVTRSCLSRVISCTEEGVMPQLQVQHVLLTNISHVEKWWFCYQDITSGKSKN